MIHEHRLLNHVATLGLTVEDLVEALLPIEPGWRNRAEIIPDYMPPYPREGTKPRCVVRCQGMFLRCWEGPSQRYFWDIYGDDLYSPATALVALLGAPEPPFMNRVFRGADLHDDMSATRVIPIAMRERSDD